MRYPSIALVLMVVVTTPLCAQASRGAPPTVQPSPGPRPTPRHPDTSPAPIILEDQWTTALTRRDAQMFDRLLAPNFVYTENATVLNRGDVMRSVTGPDRVDWARNEGMRAHDFGDVQIITGVLHTRGKARNGAFDRRYQFTDTWQRRTGRWQIIAAQDYLIPK